MLNKKNTAVFLILSLAVPLVQLAGCATTKSHHGRASGEDRVASGFEERLEQLNEAIDAQQLKRAEDALGDLDSYLKDHRRELELHPEGSMMFSRYDAVKRRMRQFRSDWAEQQAAQKKLEIENRLRGPVESASALADAFNLKKAPQMAQVQAFKQAIDAAQDTLNDARRRKDLALDDPLAQELQQRLDSLSKTCDKLRARARALELAALLDQAQQQLAASEGPGDADEKRQALTGASQAFAKCQRQGERLLEQHAELAGYRVLCQSSRKRKKVKDIITLCRRQQQKISATQQRRQQAAQAAEEKAAQLRELLQGKSTDQQRVLKKWGRVPDVTRQRRKKEVWIYVQKKGRRRHRREYTFNAAGELIRERRR